jgi:hypothetical protein
VSEDPSDDTGIVDKLGDKLCDIRVDLVRIVMHSNISLVLAATVGISSWALWDCSSNIRPQILQLVARTALVACFGLFVFVVDFFLDVMSVFLGPIVHP